MRNLSIFSTLLILSFGVAWAQPAEEVPPPPPAEEIEAEEYIPEAAPVAEPEVVEAPAAPENDPSLKGVTLSPSVQIQPFGYDNINVGGAEGKRYFFAIIPTMDLSTTFKTSHGRNVDFNIGYSLIYREYFNKGATLRDFENDIYGGFNVQWTDRISTDFSGIFVYFFKSGEDSNDDNALFFESEPHLSYKVLDNLSFQIGPWFRWLDIIDWRIPYNEQDDLSDIPSDIDDIRRGLFTENATGFDNFDPIPGGFNGQTTAFSDDTVWQMFLGTMLSAKYSPIPGTKLGMKWRYVLGGFSNADSSEYTGHYIIPSFSQKLPWEGGSISIKDELRLRKYKYTKVEGTNVARQRFRNRLSIGLNQSITDSISATIYYRFQITGENKDDYSALTKAHWFYTGFTFEF